MRWRKERPLETEGQRASTRVPTGRQGGRYYRPRRRNASIASRSYSNRSPTTVSLRYGSTSR